MPATLRSSLSDTVNELNKLLLLTTDPDEEKKLRRLRRDYYSRWEEVIEASLDSTTEEFRAALSELKKAKQAVEEAKENVAKVASAIERLVKAAKAVDKVLGIVLDMA